MNKRKLSASKCLTLGAMVTALTVLCLYAAATLPVGRLPLYFLAAVFIYVLACEGAYAAAILSYLASAALALLLLPDKLPAFAYILLLGHYGIFRTAINARMQGGLLAALIKILYCDIWTGFGLYLSMQILGKLPFSFPDWLPVWGLVVLSQVGFAFIDILYGLSTAIYESRIRRSIVPRR